MARAGERLRDEAQLGRRAAQAMDQQHAHPAAGDEQAAILKQVFVLSVHVVMYTDWAYDRLSRRGHTRLARIDANATIVAPCARPSTGRSMTLE